MGGGRGGEVLIIHSSISQRERIAIVQRSRMEEGQNGQIYMAGYDPSYLD